MTGFALVYRSLIALLCMVAVIAAPGFASCCCAATAVCQCAAPEGKSCCGKSETHRPTSCQAGDKCSSNCDCGVNATDDAVVAVTRISLECEVSHTQPAIEIATTPPATIAAESRGPPRISHNLRQSMLCVWRN